MSADEVSGTMSVDEIIAQYPGEWIVMKVTEEEDGWSSRGQILTRCGSHDEAWERLGEIGPRVKLAEGESTYIFDGYRRLRTGEEVRAALRELESMEHDPTGLERW